jgi:hypothetical protein
MPTKDKENDSQKKAEPSRETKTRILAHPPDLRERALEIVRAKDDQQLVELVKTRIVESILIELANPGGPVAAYNESDNKAYGQYSTADSYFDSIINVARRKISG